MNPIYDFASLPVLFGLPYFSIGRALELWTPNVLRDTIEWADVVLVEGPWQLPEIAKMVDETPVVYSSHNVEFERFSNLDEYPIVGRSLLQSVRQIEKKALGSADLLLTTSSRDRAIFEQRYGTTPPYIVAPNGTDRALLTKDRTNPREVRQKLGLDIDGLVGVFLGSNHPPNVESVSFLLDRLRDEDHSLELILVGTVAKSFDQLPESVVATGRVECIAPYLDAADIGLNPVTWGGGSNIKMFDYFARGLPALTTPFGTRGIDVQEGKQVLVAKRERFLPVLLNIDRGEIKRMGALAREFAVNHTWTEISSSLRTDLNSMISPD